MGKKCILFFLSMLAILIAFRFTWAEDYQSGKYRYSVLENGTAEITLYLGKEKKVKIPAVPDGYNVTSIKAQAFQENNTLEGIVIPEGIIRIGRHVFVECSKLKSVSIPISLSEWDRNPFDRCHSLIEINIAKNHPMFEVRDHVLFDKIHKQLVSYPAGLKQKDYIIPSDIKSIGPWAFSECEYLHKVIIPGSIEEIIGNPFCGCRSLSDIVIQESKIFGIFESVLFNRKTGELIAYPMALNAATYRIPEGTQYIADSAFYKNNKLVSVTMPNTLKKINANAFRECNSLTALEIPENVIEIGEYSFYQCEKLRTIKLPAKLKVINEYTFKDCLSLKTVELPSELQIIAQSAFLNCRNLEKIILPESLQHIGDRAFGNCLKITVIDFPEGLLTLGSMSFGETGLKSVTIPASVNKIRGNPFGGCKNLAKITVIQTNLYFFIVDNVLFSTNGCLISFPAGLRIERYFVPAGISELSEYAFCGCELVGHVILPEGLTIINEGAFKYCYGLASVDFPYSITIIGKSAFYGCTGLRGVGFSSGLLHIGEMAFYDCTGLVTVMFPDGMIYLGDSAFYGCVNLTYVKIPASVTYIGVNVFYKTQIKFIITEKSSYAWKWSLDTGYQHVTPKDFSPTASVPKCSTKTNLIIGDKAHTINTQGSGLVIHTGPRKFYKEILYHGEKIQIPPATEFMIIDGPECDPDGVTIWWKINYKGWIGWSAEVFLLNYKTHETYIEALR